MGTDTSTTGSAPTGSITRSSVVRGSVARTSVARTSVAQSTIDAKALAADLSGRIRGEVRFDHGNRALYATDSSNYRQVPIGVVIPRNEEDVVETVAACRRYGAPLLPRGGGTSLAGQGCNVAVVVDMSKYMNNILELDPERKLARVQPGTILDHLRAAAERHHLTFGPDPATHAWNTLGGMIGNNSCGVHSIMAGNTVDNVEALEVLTYDGLRMWVGPTSDEELEQIIAAGGRRGQIYAQLKALRDRYADLVRTRYPKIPRRVSGYNLDQLLPENGFHVARALVGTEGTCVTVLQAVVRLAYSPPVRSLLVLAYPDAYQAADHVMEILAHEPVGLEGFDDYVVSVERAKGLHLPGLEMLPEGNGWLLAEFGGESRQEADDRARAAMEALSRSPNPPAMTLFDTPQRQKAIWEVRESALGASALLPDGSHAWEGWEDAAVAPERLGGYLRDQAQLVHKYGYRATQYGHFGQGCVHLRINFDLETAEGVRQFRSFIEEAADLVVSYGGSLSGEHGDGQARAELYPKMFGPELVEAFREFKAIWDPGWKMNPGKVVDPNRMDENLRLGPDYRPRQPSTSFRFPQDQGSLARATLRCVGVSKCRRMSGGTMCPSFMVLREEKHATRGRAHLLFEMLREDSLLNGWRDETIKESLDLCLACKGCKGDCPVNVDVATYKAEFLSHYYKGRLRPRSAYALGLLPYWAPLAARLPAAANFFTQTPLLRDLAKAAVGVAPERQLPAFAPQSFKAWFRQRGSRNQGGPPVLLFPDTFNNYFYPEVLQAGVEVLEALGYWVQVPERELADGRTLYDSGLLSLARRLLRQVLETLRPQIEAGVPLVGLEPSSVAVFRDELVNLFPDDQNARRLSQQSFLLSEFLEQKAEGHELPKLHRKAVVHGHCHHKAIMTMAADERVLSKLGLDYTVLESGCCGMAGGFGYEKDHYDLSIQVGERILLPAVRAAPKDALIVADGFSCRQQIAHGTDRRALHLAQVMQMAMREGPGGPPGEYPEAGYATLTGPTHQSNQLGLAIAAGAGTLLAIGALVWGIRRDRSR